jgi:cobalamin biosynthesis protein CobC
VLRSFGKIYGLAGLRLGFAIAPAALAARLRAALGPWAVSGPVLEIGARALADTDWLVDTRLRLAADSARLDHLLRLGGFEILGGTPLFRLARHADARGWFTRLGTAGILTRPFAERPDALRFGLPGVKEHWARLEAALAGGA